MFENEQSVKRLLRKTRLEIAPEMFFLVSLGHEQWLKLLESPELSPRMTAPFMIFMDKREATLLFDEIDFSKIKDAVRGAKIESDFRLLTFDIELDFTVVGFLAEVSRILAEAGISIIALSAFSRDHLLLKQKDLSGALKALRPYIDEIC